jgi:hypothetical protein
VWALAGVSSAGVVGAEVAAGLWMEVATGLAPGATSGGAPGMGGLGGGAREDETKVMDETGVARFGRFFGARSFWICREYSISWNRFISSKRAKSGMESLRSTILP